MFNANTIFSKVLGIVGFRQTEDLCYPKLHPALLVGAEKVQSIRNTYQYLLPEFIYDTVAKFEKTLIAKVSAYNALTNYTAGDKVRYDDGTNTFVYFALQNTVGNTPIWNSVFWETDLSHYLRTSLLDSTNNGLQNVISTFLTNNILPDYLNFAPVFEDVQIATIANRTLPDLLRCLRFQLDSLRTLRCVVNQIGLRFDTAQTFNLYLYHSSQPTAVQTFPITIAAGEVNNFVWKDLVDTLGNPCILDYWANSIHNGGVFWLGFYESDIVGNFYEWITFPKPYKEWAKTNIYPSTFTALDKPNIPILQGYYTSTYSANTSLNAVVSVSFDYTNSFLGMISAISDFIKYDLAIRILQDERNSNRKNNSKSAIDNGIDMILMDKFMGERMAEAGLISETNKRVKTIAKNIKTFSGGSLIKFIFA